MVNDFPIKP